jgi:hypothetical protein
LAEYNTRSLGGAPRLRIATGAQVRSWAYDPLGRPATDTMSVNGVLRFHRAYQYTQAGDLKQVTGKNYSSTGAIWADAAASYTYDKSHRLLTAVGPLSYSATMAYTATGNIQRAKIDGPASVKPRDVIYSYGDVDKQAVDRLLTNHSTTPSL